ncbi:hypothetical protein [Nostoc sp. LEGE 12447]|nr:hypothetical protein [Nostoc sp. LEGE 12447]
MKTNKQISKSTQTQPIANLLVVILNEKEMSSVNGAGKIGSL